MKFLVALAALAFTAAAPASAANVGFQEIKIGNGAEPPCHCDTALALARAGFVAVAVSHAGDTFDDQSKVLQLWRRPAQLRRLVDYLLEEWPAHAHLDAARIGAFAGLRAVHVPMQLWRAADDRHQPHPYCEEALHIALPRAPEYHVIENAGHFDFLPPCDARLSRRAPAIRASNPGFDRAAFHEQFNQAVVQFFRTAM